MVERRRGSWWRIAVVCSLHLYDVLRMVISEVPSRSSGVCIAKSKKCLCQAENNAVFEQISRLLEFRDLKYVASSHQCRYNQTPVTT